MWYIYKIFTKYDPGKTLYVGSTKNFNQRKIQHLSDLRNPKSPRHNYPLYKYIRENELQDEVVIEVIEEHFTNSKNKEKIEQVKIDEMKPTYNQKAAKSEGDY